MTNNKQQTAVEQFLNAIKDQILLSKEHLEMIESYADQCKEMEKQQTRDDIKNELKLIGNYFDVGKLDQREQGHHIRFTSILKDRFDFYNETNGGNK
jgi:hypothetical protein